MLRRNDVAKTQRTIRVSLSKSVSSYPAPTKVQGAAEMEITMQKYSSLRWGIYVPDSWVDAVMCMTTKAPQHTYQILTKRPERMKTYLQRIVDSSGAEAIPQNLWFGVTAENQQMADSRIPILIDTPVNNRFISIEPMLTPVDLTIYINNLDWIIAGGETGQRARPMKPAWAIAIMELCKQCNVPFFFKQMTKKAPIPKELMVKEFPPEMP